MWKGLGTVLLSLLVTSAVAEQLKTDPCVRIGGQKWVAPQDLRACFQSFPVNSTIKNNIIDVVNRTLAFHTSVNYEILAPPPFTADVHENLMADLARIRAQSYPSEYELHIDLSRTLKRLNDGHCVWVNSCFVTLFLNFLPIPLVLLTDSRNVQTVHIAPAAFQVASAEFPDEIDFWQNVLPGPLKGKLKSLSGAQVLLINGQDPWNAINDNAKITGSFQALGTRQNTFFSSYQRAASSWSYIMGNFAQQALPLSDSVTLLLKLNSSPLPVVVTLPYRARIGAATMPFTDGSSLRAGNCLATEGTNGVDLKETSAPDPDSKTITPFLQQPIVPTSQRPQPINVMVDSSPFIDIALPPELVPLPTPVNGSDGVAQFYLLDDGKTGVLALGSFSGDFNTLMSGLLQGMTNLKLMGATQLIVDVTNNGGGFICVAHFLHRLIVGSKDTTVPQAGLFTTTRDGPLAQQIVQVIVENNVDPNNQLLYNPLGWTNRNGTAFAADDNWLLPPVPKIINGRKDAFSQTLGTECPPDSFPFPPPDEALFEGDKVAIVSNGRCASSCSLFSITMAKEEGSKTVVVGGKRDVPQRYCGTVGGQSTDFATIDTEVKTAQLKNSPLAPPDLLVNGAQGITWRLGFGVNDPTQPEEWQDHPADLNLPLTSKLANNPVAIWTEVAARLFK